MMVNGIKRKADEAGIGNFNHSQSQMQYQPPMQPPQGQYYPGGGPGPGGPPGGPGGDYRQQWMPERWPPPRGRMMQSFFPRRGNQRGYYQRANCRPIQNFNNYGPGWSNRPPMFQPEQPPDYQWVPNTSVPPPPPPPQQLQQQEEPEPKPKRKKKAATTQGFTARPWNRQDAEKALNLEVEFQKVTSERSIIIRFPDPDLSKEIVKRFHPAIENVHFQAPSGGRFCFVQLADSCNVDKVISDLEQIKFGCGQLKAERKISKTEDVTTPESIDPYTLYVGNLPTAINTSIIKDKFPNAARIDIGYAQKMKYTRYAFVRFSSADDAMEAYKSVANTTIASRSIILRFRRHKGPVGPRGEKPEPSTKPPKAKKEASKKEVKKEKVKPQKKVKAEKKTTDEDDDDEADDDDDDDESEEEEEEEEDEDDDDDDDDDDDEDTHNQDEDEDDEDEDDEEDDDDDEEEDDEPEDEDDDEDDHNLDDDGSDDDGFDKDVDDLFEKLGEKVVNLKWNGGKY